MGAFSPITQGDFYIIADTFARALQAPLLLIDDADGRAEAERQALAATGPLGILETAAIPGLVDLPGALARLQVTTFRARPELFQDLLERDAERKQQG